MQNDVANDDEEHEGDQMRADVKRNGKFATLAQTVGLRIPVKADGSAGPLTKLETSRPLQTPDGMRSVGNRTLLLVEGAGRLDEVTIKAPR
jgi:hypothetical protein